MDTKNPATNPGPAPVCTDSPAVWPLVIDMTPRLLLNAPPWLVEAVTADMQARHEEGCRKYGMPLTSDNGRNHMADAYQEALDGAAYARAEHHRTGGRVIWLDISAGFVRLAARIRYQLALEAEGEG